MAYNKMTAWTNNWLRHLSWRDVLKMKRQFEKFPSTNGIRLKRHRKLCAEYTRRKREGGGGLAAD